MAMGCPVVASRVGGIPEIVMDGDSGLLVAPEDPAGLERAIASLLQDEEKRRGMARAGRERVVARFGLGEMLRQLEGEYESLLAARKVRK
jgi:glycosyltransferase involved in cell wall biosynthesis